MVKNVVELRAVLQLHALPACHCRQVDIFDESNVLKVSPGAAKRVPTQGSVKRSIDRDLARQWDGIGDAGSIGIADRVDWEYQEGIGRSCVRDNRIPTQYLGQRAGNPRSGIVRHVAI